MVSAPAVATGLTREQAVPSRAKVKLPAWLEIAKPRLIPLLLATTLGGMALSDGWPLPPLRLACTLGGGALAAAATLFWEVVHPVPVFAAFGVYLQVEPVTIGEALSLAGSLGSLDLQNG